MSLETGLELQEVPKEVTAVPFRVGKGQLARSTAFNFIGQLLPLFAGLGLMRYIVKDWVPIVSESWVLYG